MYTITKASFPFVPAMALLLAATLAVPLSSAAIVIPPGGLAATKSGNDLILFFPTTSPNLYTLQTRPDLLQPWTNLQSAIPGDGTVKTTAISNAFSADKAFYRLSIQKPASLVLPQSYAFAILGYDCGGIKEQASVTGFDPATGYITGNVYLSTICSAGKGTSSPHSAWASVTWDLAANVVSYGALSSAPTVNTNFTATDAYGDTIFNTGTPTPAAYLGVPIPAAPTAVTAVQSGDQFGVNWMVNGINPAAITSSTLTATPINSTNSVLTTTVAGPATSGVITTLQPQTTYELTVVNTTISGSSLASTPIDVTTVPASIPPSAPTNVVATWEVIDPSGTNDTINATWQAAVPGNSPVNQYLITIIGSDGAGTFTQTVSGTTLSATFNVNDIPNWTVTVQAHNAAGWGPSSTPITLGGL